MTYGKAMRPSEETYGKEKEVDAGLNFAAYLCVGSSPYEQPRKEKA